MPALIRATERGKQAVCLVELKARFDERANIGWARALEEAGVHVVYGHPSLKTHAKCLLVVRREGDGVRHYVHVGTGNYHPQDGAPVHRLRPVHVRRATSASDVADMFNFLTGFARPRRYRKVLVAPNFLRDGIIDEIEQTVAAHEDGKPARIAHEDELARRPPLHPRAVPRVAGRRAGRPQHPRHLLPRARASRASARTSASSPSSGASSSTRGSTRSSAATSSASTSARPTSCRATSTRASSSSRRSRTPSLRDDLLDTLERSLADDTNAWELQPDATWRRREQQGAEPRVRPARADDRARRAGGRGRPHRRGLMGAEPGGELPLQPEHRRSPSQAVADIRIRAPTRGNRRLERLLDAVNGDPQVKAWWHVAGRQRRSAWRCPTTPGSTSRSSRTSRCASRGCCSARGDRAASMVADHGMSERDAEVVIAAGCAVPLRRHVDPPHRPRGVLAVPHRGQARRAAGGRLRGARALGRSSPRRCTR